jgi:hypothetical protein
VTAKNGCRHHSPDGKHFLARTLLALTLNGDHFGIRLRPEKRVENGQSEFL